MNLKYFTVERSDRSVSDVLSKMRRELGPMRLYSYSPLIELGGNLRILELKAGYADSFFTVKIDGPEFLIKELQEYFINGGRL